MNKQKKNLKYTKPNQTPKLIKLIFSDRRSDDCELQARCFHIRALFKLKLKPLILNKMNAVEKLLSQSINVDGRAKAFTESIQRNLQKKVLDVLTEEKEKLVDDIFQAKDFTLRTDVNSGQVAVTREQAEQRFDNLMQLEYKLVFVEIELKERQAIFDKYFKAEEDDTSRNEGV